MKVHIGKIISEAVKKKGLTNGQFAAKMGYHERNVFKLYNKASIDTGVLARISKVVGQNLFLHYVSDADMTTLQPAKAKDQVLYDMVTKLSVKLKAMEETYGELKGMATQGVKKVKKKSLKKLSDNES